MPQNFATDVYNQKQAELEQLKMKRQIKDVLGLSSIDAYERYRNNVIKGLYQFGNIFLGSLGGALEDADFRDSIRILNVWQKECIEHELLWRIYEAKEKAKNDEVQTV